MAPPPMTAAEPGRVRVYHDSKLLGTGQLQEYSILAPER